MYGFYYTMYLYAPLPRWIESVLNLFNGCYAYCMLKLELRYCMLQHPSSQVSYLHTCNRIPVDATNCQLIFVLWYVQFRNKLLPRNPACSSLTPTCPGRCFVLQVSTTKFHSKKQTAYYTMHRQFRSQWLWLPVGLLGNTGIGHNYNLALNPYY